MKKTAILALAAVLGLGAAVKAADPVKLPAPSKERGCDVMKAFEQRRSTREFSPRELSMQDLSDVLWAAAGINRPETGMRTNPTSRNRQEISLWVCTAKGNYAYDHKTHALIPLSETDVRPQPGDAPAVIVIGGPADFPPTEVDAGIVSQNISLLCAGAGLATVPRATMERETLQKALGLDEKTKLVLNHPVGYFVK